MLAFSLFKHSSTIRTVQKLWCLCKYCVSQVKYVGHIPFKINIPVIISVSTAACICIRDSERYIHTKLPHCLPYANNWDRIGFRSFRDVHKMVNNHTVDQKGILSCVALFYRSDLLVLYTFSENSDGVFRTRNSPALCGRWHTFVGRILHHTAGRNDLDFYTITIWNSCMKNVTALLYMKQLGYTETNQPHR